MRLSEKGTAYYFIAVHDAANLVICHRLELQFDLGHYKATCCSCQAFMDRLHAHNVCLAQTLV